MASPCELKEALSNAEAGDAAAVLATPAAARVLSLLKPNSIRTLEYLHRSSGLSIRTVRRNLRMLEELTLVKSANTGSYLLGEKLLELDRELWAFEVKVDNWQRALFQALQYRAFADRVVVAVAGDYVHRVRRHASLFRSFRIGLLAVHPPTRSVEVVLPAFRGPPTSKFHRFQALGRFLIALRTSPAGRACSDS